MGHAAQLRRRHQSPCPLCPLPLPCPHRRPQRCSRCMVPARTAPDGAAPQTPVGEDPHLPLPPPVRQSGTRRVGQRHPMQTLCDAHKAPVCKSCRRHRGVRHCCNRHHQGHPGLVLAAGGARQRTLIGMGGLCAPSPPLSGEGRRCRQWGGTLTGSPCAWHTLDSGRRSTYPGA